MNPVNIDKYEISEILELFFLLLSKTENESLAEKLTCAIFIGCEMRELTDEINRLSQHIDKCTEKLCYLENI